MPPPQPTQVFSFSGFEAVFPRAGILGCTVCLAPQLFLPVYPHGNAGPPALSATSSSALPSATLHESSLPGCPSLPLPLAWMNVSSLTPCLSDFHTVQFSGSSGCFLSLNLLLSFFWLCEEAQCVYLRLHPGRKLF